MFLKSGFAYILHQDVVAVAESYFRERLEEGLVYARRHFKSTLPVSVRRCLGLTGSEFGA